MPAMPICTTEDRDSFDVLYNSEKISLKNSSRCPRCGEGVLKSWPELTSDEQEVVKRLPGAVTHMPAERQATHEWCTRCWNEVEPQPRQV
jgi:DNA-directed RNA polymerase subunit RPC12/RpoP